MKISVMKEIVNDWMAGGLGIRKGGVRRRWGSGRRRNKEVGEEEEEGVEGVGEEEI